MREYKIGDKLSGGEAIQYLSEYAGARFVFAVNAAYRIDPVKHLLQFFSSDTNRWFPASFTVEYLIKTPFTVCTDPSLPKEVDSYEKDKAAIYNGGGLINVRYDLMPFIEKYFVRKGDSRD